MRAVVATRTGPFDEEGLLQVQTLDALTAEEGQVRIAVESCGITFPDILTVEGKHFQKRAPPFVPCSEVAGVVAEVGPGVQGVKLGDRVFGVTASGALATQAVLSADSCYVLPAGLDVHVAAGFEVNYGTTWHGLVDLAGLCEGETLLVLGASGGVGMAAIDIGKAVGAHVIACASTAEKLAACEAQGADVVVKYSEKGFKQQLVEAGAYGSVDVVYDPVGGRFTETALKSLGFGGRLIVVGFASGGANPNGAIPRIPANQVLLNERRVIGLFWGVWKFGHRDEHRANMDRMLRLVQSGKLRPTVSKVFAFEDHVAAFAHLMRRQAVCTPARLPGAGRRAHAARRRRLERCASRRAQSLAPFKNCA